MSIEVTSRLHGWFVRAVCLCLIASLIATPTMAVAASSSTLLSQQTSAVADEIVQETVDCGNGNSGIGKAARDAVTIHVGLAQATPRVDDLFAGDCFASLNQLLDLSGFINAGIWSALVQAAKQFIMQWLQNRICTAIQDVTGRAFAPINSAISQLNGLIGGLNGWSNNLNGGNWLNSALPNGKSAEEPRVNSFAGKSLTFAGFDPKVDAAQMEAANAAVERINRINGLMAESSTARLAVASAQMTYANCLAARTASCDREKSVIDQARAVADQLSARVQQEVSSMQGGAAPTRAFVMPKMPAFTRPAAIPAAPAVAPPPAAAPAQQPAPRPQNEPPKGEAERMGGLFSSDKKKDD